MSRKITTPGKGLLAVLFFLLVIGLFAAQYAASLKDSSFFTRLSSVDVLEIRAFGQSFKNEEEIKIITDGLKLTKPYDLQNEGCLQAQRMDILLRDGHKITIAISYSKKHETLVYQITDNALPPCIWGAPLYSIELTRAFRTLHAIPSP